MAGHNEVVHLDSGVVLPLVSLDDPKLAKMVLSRQVRNRGDFAMTDQSASAKLAMNKDITHTDRTIVWYLMSLLNYSNELKFQSREVAEELGLTESTVSRGLKRLVAAGILHKGDRVGRSFVYIMDPEYAWRGSAKDRATVVKKIESLRQ